MGALQLVHCNGFAVTRIWKAARAIFYVEPSAFANAFPQPLGPGGVRLRFEHVRMCSPHTWDGTITLGICSSIITGVNVPTTACNFALRHG